MIMVLRSTQAPQRKQHNMHSIHTCYAVFALVSTNKYYTLSIRDQTKPNRTKEEHDMESMMYNNLDINDYMSLAETFSIIEMEHGLSFEDFQKDTGASHHYSVQEIQDWLGY